jgi:predicted nucleic acid-binding protein
MIYLDTSTTVKLVAAEEESTALIDWLNGRPDESLATNVIGHIVLMRAAARAGTRAVALARHVASSLDTLVLTDAIAAAAAAVQPAELRTFGAIHLATARTHRQSLTALRAHDHRLLEAAETQGLPIVSPRGDADTSVQ